GQALGIARCLEPCPAPPRPRTRRRSPQATRPRLRLVHRRLRHAGPEGGEGAPRRTPLSRLGRGNRVASLQPILPSALSAAVTIGSLRGRRHFEAFPDPDTDLTVSRRFVAR